MKRKLGLEIEATSPSLQMRGRVNITSFPFATDLG
jgi:hypothetical protein